jgi:hypothetical protein
MIINWIMNLINEFLFVLIWPCILIGVSAIAAAKFVPNFLPQYKLPMQIGGLVLVLFFLFQAGREWEYDKYKVQREADKVLIEKLSAESKAASGKIKIQYVEKIKYVDKIKNIPVIEYVDKEADKQCVISPAVGTDIARLLNAAATGKLPAAATGTNATIK